MIGITDKVSHVAILGASGFIGKYLVSSLLRDGGYEIKVLSRDRQRDLQEARFEHGVEIFEGDISDPESLNGFLLPGCTVINLVYLWNAGEEQNLTCTHNLLAACKAAKVARLIHCSTAAVAGRTQNNRVDEQTPCLPITEYGTTKLRIEQQIIDFGKGHFEVVILRPTSVYGIDGEPLKKLAVDISTGNRWKNYLKSCLFGRRRMNLVHVDNVVAAIQFFIEYEDCLNGELFIVSDDDDVNNNFIYVERLLMNALGVRKYFLPIFQVPLFVLKSLLLLLGRNNVNPRCNFDASKLRKLGFKSPVSLNNGLTEYATWYRALYFNESESRLL